LDASLEQRLGGAAGQSVTRCTSVTSGAASIMANTLPMHTRGPPLMRKPQGIVEEVQRVADEGQASRTGRDRQPQTP
jgi:hypothetical protein